MFAPTRSIAILLLLALAPGTVAAAPASWAVARPADLAGARVWQVSEPTDRARDAFDRTMRNDDMRAWASFIRRYGDNAGRELRLEAEARFDLHRLTLNFGPRVVPEAPAGASDTLLVNATGPRPDTRAEDPDLLFARGQALALGDGVRRDPAEAVMLLARAAAAGHRDAAYVLGAMLVRGDGVPRDPTRAADLFQMAAEKGHATAAYDLGYLYRHGQGVPENTSQALHWFRQAAEGGERRAFNTLAIFHLQGLAGLPKNPNEAARLLARAAEVEDPPGLANYSLFVDRGIGTTRDPARAAALTARALKLGHRPTLDDMVRGARRHSPEFRAELQRILAAAGQHPGRFDGVFDATTARALEAYFQPGSS